MPPRDPVATTIGDTPGWISGEVRRCGSAGRRGVPVKPMSPALASLRSAGRSGPRLASLDSGQIKRRAVEVRRAGAPAVEQGVDRGGHVDRGVGPEVAG